MEALLFDSGKFEVPYHAVLKNGKEIKYSFKSRRSYIGSSDRAITAAETLRLDLRRIKFREKLYETIEGPIRLQILFYFNNWYTKKGKMSKTVADTSNLYQIIEDALEHKFVKIISNDRLVDNHDGSRRLPSEDDRNWLHIKIWEVSDGEHYK